MKVETPESTLSIEMSYMEFVALLLLLILAGLALSEPSTADQVATSTTEVLFGYV